MKHYELTYLISSEISEEELKSLPEKINSFLREGGILIEVNSPIKKKFAYPIEKKIESFLVTIFFQLPPEKISDLEKKLKSESKILRYFLVSKKLPKKIEVPIKKISKPRKEPKKEKKVELKEIEKKLEEILGK